MNNKSMEPLSVEVGNSFEHHPADASKEMETSGHDESNASSSSSASANNRSLINSIPKPFKSESPPTTAVQGPML
jgi:hypothetical protein